MARSAASAEQLLAELRPYIGDERVLAALAAVPRDLFVPDKLGDHAWDNTALPIGSGQTISQPVVVARVGGVLGLRPPQWGSDAGPGPGTPGAVRAGLRGGGGTTEQKPP